MMRLASCKDLDAAEAAFRQSSDTATAKELHEGDVLLSEEQNQVTF